MFSSRTQAGVKLAEKLTMPNAQTLVLGIPRGGVVVAFELAKALKLQLDVLPVKKLGAPGNPELAIGALAPDNVSHIEWRIANNMGADEAYMKEELQEKSTELKQQEKIFRKKKKPLKIRDKAVILVDDGVATGSTMEAAIKWARAKKARKIMVALPIAAGDTVKRIKPEVDELIVLEIPADFHAVGQYYEEFPQVEDEEVVRLLESTKS